MSEKIYCFDLDNTLCKTLGEDYSKSEPIQERIKIVNKLYDEGNEVIIFTARGSVTGIDWTELTEKQLKFWNVKYTKLLLGKPAADFYIDDKASDPFGWFT